MSTRGFLIFSRSIEREFNIVNKESWLIKPSLHEKCPITEFYSVNLPRKSSYSVQIQENMDQKKLCIWTFFTQCITLYRQHQMHISLQISTYFNVKMLSSMSNLSIFNIVASSSFILFN